MSDLEDFKNDFKLLRAAIRSEREWSLLTLLEAERDLEKMQPVPQSLAKVKFAITVIRSGLHDEVARAEDQERLL